MIPYVPQPEIVLGGHHFYAFGLLVGLAIVVGAIALVRRAGVHLNRTLVMWLTVHLVWWSLFGSHVLYLLFFDSVRLRERPWILFDLTTGIYSLGGIFWGVAALAICARRYGLSRSATLRYLDSAAYVFPTAWVIARSGCALAHDHVGIKSSSWIAVNFPGGSRYDLGLLEMLFTLALMTVWRWLDRHPRPTPFFLCLACLLYGPFRIWIHQLREPAPIGDLAFGLALIVAGIALLPLGFVSSIVSPAVHAPVSRSERAASSTNACASGVNRVEVS